MNAWPLALLLAGCATPLHPPACPTVAGPMQAVGMCTAMPLCKHHCNLTVSGATNTGEGAQTITTHSQPSVTETRTTTGPLP